MAGDLGAALHCFPGHRGSCSLRSMRTAAAPPPRDGWPTRLRQLLSAQVAETVRQMRRAGHAGVARERRHRLLTLRESRSQPRRALRRLRKDDEGGCSNVEWPALSDVRTATAPHLQFVSPSRSEGAQDHQPRPNLRRLLPPAEGCDLQQLLLNVVIRPSSTGHRHAALHIVLGPAAHTLHPVR